MITAKDDAQLSARITHSEPEKNEEGEITGYQAVGNVNARCKSQYTMQSEGGTMQTTFTGSGHKNYPFRPESGTAWCTLDVNPGRRLYRLGLPSAYIEGKEFTIITAADGNITTESKSSSCDVGGWTENGYSVVKDRSYDPRTGIIAGTHTQVMYSGPGVPPPEGSGAITKPGEFLYEAAQQGGHPLQSIYYTISWTLQIGKPPARVVLEPEESYDKWMPQLPMGAGNIIKVKARIVEPEGAEGYITFKLEDVSKEPGICLNFPFDDTKTDPDLTIHKTLSGMWVSDDGQQAKTEKVNEATVVVQAHDWGAYGKLSATAKLIIGGEEIEVPAVFEDTGEHYVTIPQDTDDNSIADEWQRQNEITGCSGKADEDEEPNSNYPGDGLSAYEEYRGVHIMGKHVRLDPHKKDLFIYDPDDLVKDSFIMQGAAGELQVHLVTYGEMNCGGKAKLKRVVNFNHDRYHIVDQHGLWVIKHPGKNEWHNWGECGKGGFGEPAPPKTADPYVYIFVDQIERDLRKTFNDNIGQIRFRLEKRGIKADEAWLQQKTEECIKMVVTHEIGHGIGIKHHETPPGTTEEDIYPSQGAWLCPMRYPWEGSRPGAPVTAKPYDETVDILSGQYSWSNRYCTVCMSQIHISDEGY